MATILSAAAATSIVGDYYDVKSAVTATTFRNIVQGSRTFQENALRSDDNNNILHRVRAVRSPISEIVPALDLLEQEIIKRPQLKEYTNPKSLTLLPESKCCYNRTYDNHVTWINHGTSIDYDPSIHHESSIDHHTPTNKDTLIQCDTYIDHDTYVNNGTSIDHDATIKHDICTDDGTLIHTGHDTHIDVVTYVNHHRPINHDTIFKHDTGIYRDTSK
uniref:Uncharacterized protein n=1 Tax=Romanomermis culicivorax TaxID=13658 RepID=A0A915IHW9_ROMCU